MDSKQAEGSTRSSARRPDEAAVRLAGGYRAPIELLENSAGGIDAVVAANDLIGIGELHAADDLRLRTPEDVPITGVDDAELQVRDSTVLRAARPVRFVSREEASA